MYITVDVYKAYYNNSICKGNRSYTSSQTTQKQKISGKRCKSRLNPGDSNGCKKQLLVSPEKAVNFTAYFSVKCTRSQSDMADFDVPPATKRTFLALFK